MDIIRKKHQKLTTRVHDIMAIFIAYCTKIKCSIVNTEYIYI